MILAPLTCHHYGDDNCFCVCPCTSWKCSKPLHCWHAGGADCECLIEPRLRREHPLAVELVPRFKTGDAWRELGTALWRVNTLGWTDVQMRDALHHSALVRLRHVGKFDWMREDFTLLHDAVCDPSRCPGLPPKFRANVMTTSATH